MTNFQTEIFKVPASVYLKAEARDFALRRGWIIALPVLAAFGAGLFDARFLIIGLLILFVVIPPAMALIYFYRLLSPEAREAMALKSVSGEQGKELRVSFYTADPSGEKPPQKVSEKVIPLRDVISVAESGTYRIVRIKGRELPLIIEADSEGLPRTDFFGSER